MTWLPCRSSSRLHFGLMSVVTFELWTAAGLLFPVMVPTPQQHHRRLSRTEPAPLDCSPSDRSKISFFFIPENPPVRITYLCRRHAPDQKVSSAG